MRNFVTQKYTMEVHINEQGYRETCKPRREALEETNPADTFILDF
jgi:hypothetical protein